MDPTIGSSNSHDAKKKKLALIGLAFVGVVLMLIIIFSLFSRSSKNTSNQSQLPNQVQITPIKPISNQNNGWNVERSEDFKVEYPPTWNKKVFKIVTGGYHVGYFLDNPNSTTEIFPRVDIEVTPYSSEKSPEIRAKNLSGVYRFPITETEFKNQKAIQVSGFLPEEFQQGSPAKITKTFIIFVKDGKTYFIDYAYFEDQNAAASKNEINKILDSFEFE